MKIWCALTIVVAMSSSGLAQPAKTRQRKIVSGDFPRPAAKQTTVSKPLANKSLSSKHTPSKALTVAKATGEKKPKPQPPRTYRLASSTTDAPAPKIRNSVVAQLGVTMWRLRPMTPQDNGATVIVKEDGHESEWVGERVEADTVFRKGDFVRLSIESPHTGYLYVVNRDQFDDGSKGDPMLIYPWGGMGPNDNRVRPGKVVDIPSQQDVPSYFKANPTRANQVGELLTFIVTKTRLDLPITDEPLRLSTAQFAEWQKWQGDSARFEMEGGAGELWTEAEKQAASGLRARQLTRTDPTPQTIYRVTASKKTGFVVNVRLAYGK